MKLRRFAIPLLALCLIGGATLAWFKLRKVQAEADLPSAKSRQGEFLVIVRCRGELGAERSVQIAAPLRVSDLQIVWMAPPGSAVAAGHPVIRFDPSGANQQVNVRTASLRQAQANLEQAAAQARITAEQDKLDLGKARYELERARLEASQQAIRSEIQGAEANIDARVAEGKLRVAEASIELHRKSDEAKLASLTRLLDQEQRELDIAQRQIAFMEVKTPIAGVITYLTNTSQGWMNAQPFKVGDHAFPGAVVAAVPDLTTIRVEAKIEEVDRGQLTVGNPGLVRIDALPEKTWKASLVSISPLTEQSFEWPPTRSFRAYIALDEPSPELRPGMNSSADIIINRLPNAISVPAKAVFSDQGRPIVYLKNAAGAYEPHPITIEARNPDEVAVKGLEPDKQIALVEPPQKAKP